MEGKLRVHVDGRMIFHSGIGRYIRNLCRELATHTDEISVSLMIDPVLAARAGVATGASEKIDYTAPIYSLTEQLRGSWICRSRLGRRSVFHFPNYNAPWFLPRNSVVTIHDLTHFRYPEFFGSHRTRIAIALLRRIARRAGHLIAVSRATADALEDLLPETRGKIATIHHGIDATFRPLRQPRRAGHVQADRFLLFVGNGKPHKNLRGVLEAFALFRRRFPRVVLVLVGHGCAQHVTDRLPTASVQLFPEVTDEQLLRLYNDAEALVMPSLNEGFGFPALEAMACGTPVIGSDLPAQAEVIGDGGLLVDPRRPDLLAAAMQLVLSSGDVRSRLRRQGLRRARDFCWQRAARRTLEVYRGVAGD